VKEQWHSSGIAGKRIETIEKLRKGFSQMKIPFLVATLCVITQTLSTKPQHDHILV